MKPLLFSISLLFVLTATAQDFVQVSVGPQYAMQSFYNLDTDKVDQIPNESWDIAFSNIGRQDAGVIINEAASLSGAPLELYSAYENNWDNPMGTQDTLTQDNRLYNTEKSWTEGAFNSSKNPMNPFDYGWGEYIPQEQRVVGNKVFILKMRDGSLKKIQITEGGVSDYTFIYANMDGSDEQVRKVAREPGVGVMFFSITDDTAFPLPQDCDLMFKRYAKPLDDGAGGILDYVVLGVLAAPGVETVRAAGVDPNAVDHADYYDSYTATTDNIGHDWKVFDLNEGGWVVPEDRTYFAAAKSGKIYQMTFIDFEGSSTGTSTFIKTCIGSTSTLEELDIELNIFPNPTSDYLNVNADESIERIYLLDQSGRLIQEYNDTQNTLQLPGNLNSGQYNLMIVINDNVITKQISVSK